MFRKVLRKLTATKPVEFCDTCAQVCTAQCRTEALFDRSRAQAAYQYLPFMR